MARTRTADANGAADTLVSGAAEVADLTDAPANVEAAGPPGAESPASDEPEAASQVKEIVSRATDVARACATIADQWIEEHRTLAMLSAFAVGVFVGASRRQSGD